MTEDPEPRRPVPADLVEFVAAERASDPVTTDTPLPERLGLFLRLRQLATQLLRFGLVGGVGFFIDIGVFNLLSITFFTDDRFVGATLVAKTLSTLVAIAWNWVGNRYWTFRRHRRENSTREAVEFFAVSLAGLVVGLLPLWIIHYGFGFDSLAADNVSNLIGLAIGSVFRFVLYRWWVFSPARATRDARSGPLPAR
ncbi:putative flippase GtrA [Pseudoclavibacter chungangensis]|uniref:GtrA family protein n=1 Tax=Pseudoclavibacter chungangensis TaxID=587635 RepID=UPI0015CA82A5|nr:GtrA family protein [Pseudoclavibacter chungangensis]NYJ67682.1 putative flippase GtrA [Pseudoclavibacter chungangensis]